MRRKRNYCFVCGQDNRHGMRLRFRLDESGTGFVCDFRLGRRYSGPPGYCHGGIIATILDDAMSKLNKLREVVAVTSKITVDYLRPVPLHSTLRVEARELTKRGRRLTYRAQIRDAKGRVLAKGQGVFVVVNPDRLFRTKV
ncbi:MAG: PaaI family thioesterase [Acidobacteria bacterium]|nr:PaaI family thioesterase [Acidobacteriota bacterium]